MTIASRKSQIAKGFTLIELIIVIAIIAILAAAIFVAIDPARRLHEARNATRNNDISSILEALKTYQADNDGNQFTTVNSMDPDLVYQIGTSPTGCVMSCFGVSTQDRCVDLSAIGSNYLAKIPYDPTDGTATNAAYGIIKDSNGALTVIACLAEGEGPGGNGVPPDLRVTR